jgi:protein phosphatase
VDEQFLDAALKCGKCGQTFTVRTAASPGAPADSSTARGGFRAALRGIFQSLQPGGTPEPPAAASPDVESDENEAFLDLDGPAAASPSNRPTVATDATPSASMASYRLEVGGATSVGRVRSRNEDSFLIQQLTWSNQDRRRDLALVVVADGMGGYAAGDQASGLLIQAVAASLTPLLQHALAGNDTAPPALAEAISEAIKHGNRLILQQAQADSACKGMGATVAVVLIWDGHVLIGHVGDCRVYHQGADRLTQVTRDQTLVARMVELGHLSPEEAQVHPSRNEVLQAVGRHPDLEPAAYEATLKAGEWLLVACDGLHAHVNSVALENAIWSATSAAQLAARLVELADEGGGSDNCTVVAVRCY